MWCDRTPDNLAWRGHLDHIALGYPKPADPDRKTGSLFDELSPEDKKIAESWGINTDSSKRVDDPSMLALFDAFNESILATNGA